jgi:hypothetical protein
MPAQVGTKRPLNARETDETRDSTATSVWSDMKKL